MPSRMNASRSFFSFGLRRGGGGGATPGCAGQTPVGGACTEVPPFAAGSGVRAWRLGL